MDTRVSLPPIRKTDMAYRFTRGGATKHQECWGAETLDGIWGFHRFDEPGTPWGIYHRPSVADGSYLMPVMECGSLRKCQIAVAKGWAEADLERRKREWAEERAS